MTEKKENWYGQDEFSLNNAPDDALSDTQLALKIAIEKAKEFHPIGKMFVNGYTGEINKYKTPDNYIPDEGVCCSSPDLCHTEDHVSIAQMYERLKAMKALSIQDSDFDFEEDSVTADDLDEDTLSDVVSGVDDPSDYENYVMPFMDDKYGAASEPPANDSAAGKVGTESKIEDEANEAS